MALAAGRAALEADGTPRRARRCARRTATSSTSGSPSCSPPRRPRRRRRRRPGRRRWLRPGRARLQSDLDVVLLHAGRADIGALAERLWYPIWDEGLKLGHAVRTAREALALAADDLDTATSLLQVRHLAGDEDLTDDLARRALGSGRSGPSAGSTTCRAGCATRHETAGEVAFLLEPDLKEGRGGLRDVHALRWAEAARSLLFEGDDPVLDDAYDALLAARVELHRRTGRPGDVLLLQDQDAVAAALSDESPTASCTAVAAAARTIAWRSDDAWQRIDASLQRTARLAIAARQGARRRASCCATARSTSPPTPTRPPTRPRAAGGRGRGRRRHPHPPRLARAPGGRRGRAARAVAGRGADARSSTCSSPGTAPSRSSRPSTRGASGCTCCPSGSPCAASRSATPTTASPSTGTWSRRAPTPPALVARVDRPDLLVLGALLHDIGKGCPGDHTDVGMELVGDDRPADGLPARGRRRARRRWCATTCCSPTSPPGATSTTRPPSRGWPRPSATCSPWGCWPPSPRPTPWPPARPRGARGRPSSSATSSAGSPTSSAAAPPRRSATSSRPPSTSSCCAPGARCSTARATGSRWWPPTAGPLRRVAGVLALHGLGVLDAAVTGLDGMALEVLRVESSFGPTIAWDKVVADLERVLEGRLALQARLAERARVYGAAPRRAPVHEPPRVVVDNAGLARRHRRRGARRRRHRGAVPDHPRAGRAGAQHRVGQGPDPRRPGRRRVLRAGHGGRQAHRPRHPRRGRAGPAPRAEPT